MNQEFSDHERFDEIESLCAILTINNCEMYLRKIPLETEDPTGEQFLVLSKLMQSIKMWPTTFGSEKCTIAQVIIEYNQNFNIPVANISGYFNDACINDAGGVQHDNRQ